MKINNLEVYLVSSIGIIGGLLFDDLRKLIINDFIVEIFDHYFVSKKYITVFGAKLNTKKMLSLIITILFTLLVIIIIDMNYKFDESSISLF